MNEKTLKFGNIAVNKKEFRAFKQSIALNLVDADKLVVSDKFNTVKMVLNTLLAIWMMMISLDLCALYCLK